jgi:hypothetical protein
MWLNALLYTKIIKYSLRKFKCMMASLMTSNQLETRTVIHWVIMIVNLIRGAARTFILVLNVILHYLKQSHQFSWVKYFCNCRYFREQPRYWQRLHDYQRNRRHTTALHCVLLHNKLHFPFYWWATVLTEQLYTFCFGWSWAYIPKLIQHVLRFNFSGSLLSCHDFVCASRTTSSP